MFVYKRENQIPVKSWIPHKEYLADEKMVTQVEHLASLPFAFHHIALMPDGHVGYGMPIGGVLATKDIIIPNAVGVDIGCGMCAVKTSLTNIDTETIKKIMEEIRKQIPVGFNRHKKDQDFDLMPDIYAGSPPEHVADDYEGYPVVSKEFDNALYQIGTLGSGNHFIEIQKSSNGHIWIMIHSGSRNLGKQVADHYNKLAVHLNEKWHSKIPKEWELAFLPVDSNEGQAYLKEMSYCVDFALANRKLMMDRILNIFSLKTNTTGERTYEPMINIAHNYASLENHFGENVMVHRKGATLAATDTIGIIPGSQGTASYIVKGKGNPESFNSCSHGAGRKMGRKEAERTLNLEEEIKKLDEQNILHAIHGKKDLDEASGAYKPIDEVMANQQDLIEILVKLSPLAVIKG